METVTLRSSVRAEGFSTQSLLPSVDAIDAIDSNVFCLFVELFAFLLLVRLMLPAVCQMDIDVVLFCHH